MDFSAERDKTALEEADSLLRNWQRWGRLPRLHYRSNALTIYEHMKMFNDNLDAHTGYRAEPSYCTLDDELAQKVEALIKDRGKWYAHHYERATLIAWYDWRNRDYFDAQIIARRKLHCGLRHAEKRVIEALRYFNAIRDF